MKEETRDEIKKLGKTRDLSRTDNRTENKHSLRLVSRVVPRNAHACSLYIDSCWVAILIFHDGFLLNNPMLSNRSVNLYINQNIARTICHSKGPVLRPSVSLIEQLIARNSSIE